MILSTCIKKHEAHRTSKKGGTRIGELHICKSEIRESEKEEDLDLHGVSELVEVVG